MASVTEPRREEMLEKLRDQDLDYTAWLCFMATVAVFAFSKP